jgi:hypothetical protein
LEELSLGNGKTCNCNNASQSLTFGAAADLWAALLTYSLRREDSDFLVFCFAGSEDAQDFAERVGGEPLATAAGDHPESTRASEARFSGRAQGAERQLV